MNLDAVFYAVAITLLVVLLPVVVWLIVNTYLLLWNDFQEWKN